VRGKLKNGNKSTPYPRHSITQYAKSGKYFKKIKIGLQVSYAFATYKLQYLDNKMVIF